jgi:predicted house-cleaning noncanonical NTP pyrophosphatase (MazG superfamily)
MMFFVDIDPSSGHPTCLPWFYNTDVLPKFDQSQSIRNKVATSFVLSSNKDFESLDRLVRGGEYDDTRSPRALLVKLKPRGELVRSQDFLRRTIELLKGKSCVVELEGSMLTHSYYLLARSKIPVKCVDPFEPKPLVRRFGKLVRDLIPVRIESHGEAAYTIKASPRDLVELLKAKAVEEAFELYWETRRDQMHEELADLLEVINSICEVTGRKFDDLVSLAEKKRADRGGFQSGVILIETREVPLIDRIAPDGVGDDDEGATGFFSRIARPSSREQGYTPRKHLGSPETDFQLTPVEKKFAFPLVPPSVSSLNKVKQFSVAGGRWVIELTYQEKRVLLSLRRKTKKEGDTKQLLLF